MEQQFAAINQQCKKIIFDNCRNIAGNCCSQNTINVFNVWNSNLQQSISNVKK